MKKITTAVMLLASAGIMFAKGNQITTSGSTTVLPVAQRCAEAFMDKNDGISITVRGGGSSVGAAALIDGTADVGNMSRAMKSKEIATARSKGVQPKGVIVALDGITPVVNPANTVANLSIQQLQDIFTGKINNWKEVGGKSGSIVVVSRDTSSGTYEVWAEKVLMGKKLKDGALMLAANKAVATTISETPGAIGYVGIAFITKEMKPVTVNGIAATEETVRNKTAPIARPLYMYVNGEPTGALKQFIDFILSSEGQALVKEVGYVAVK